MSPPSQNSACRCPHCETPLGNSIVCESCGTLTEFDPQAAHFDLFDLPRVFDIDNEQLSRAYRTLARAVHPDQFADRSQRERELATRMSARLNEAFQTLRDPVLRADYLLTLHGGPSSAECREVPGPLLAEVMEIRERIEEAKSSGKISNWEPLRETVAERRAATLAKIETACASLDGASETARRDLRKLLNSMKYFDNLLNDLADDPLSTASPAAAM